MFDPDKKLRADIAMHIEGEDEPAFHCSSCGLTSDKSDCFKPRLSEDLRCPDCGETVEHWTPDRWVPFWFDSNAACGTAHDRNDWESIRVDWARAGFEPSRIYDAKCTVEDRPNRMKSFGFYSEHSGSQTLRDFFKKNGMRL